MGRLEGKVAIVTGAASGIGRATVLRLVEEGAAVMCVDRDAAGLARTVALANAPGHAASAVADVADERAVLAYTNAVVERWGGLDVVVNNAGVLGQAREFHSVSDQELERVFAVNVRGVAHGCRHAIPHLLDRGRGSIVNVSSVNGIGKIRLAGNAVYAASKAAVAVMTKGIALDYATRGIRCNVIAPGWVDTAMVAGGEDGPSVADVVPLGRAGDPREIAEVALFLASDESSFLTGSVVVADGGMTIL